MNIQKGFTIGLALGFAFGLGGAVAATLVPAAQAQSRAQRWEYLAIDHGWDDGHWAADAGAQGWELIQVGRGNGQTCLFFRRPLP